MSENEFFSLFDHLALYNVFEHFVFCTKTCDINDFCSVCSRVYFKDISVNNLCKNMFLKVYLKKKTRTKRFARNASGRRFISISFWRGFA